MIGTATKIGNAFAASTSLQEFLDLVQSYSDSELRLEHDSLSHFLNHGSVTNTNRLLIGGWISRWDLIDPLPFSHSERVLAESVFIALSAIAEWPRSRLPGYPLDFYLPHLDRRAPDVYRESIFVSGVPWWVESRLRFGFNRRVCSPLNQWTGIGLPDEGDSITELVAVWGEEFIQNDNYRSFKEARSKLTDADRSQCKDIVKSYRELVVPSKVDHFEPSNLLRRQQYRKDCLQQVSKSVKPRIKEYYRTFMSVQRMLDHQVQLLSQIAMGEGVELVENVDSAIVETDSEGKVTVDVVASGISMFAVAPGKIYRVNNGYRDHRLMVTAVNSRFQQSPDEFSGVRFSGEVLQE